MLKLTNFYTMYILENIAVSCYPCYFTWCIHVEEYFTNMSWGEGLTIQLPLIADSTFIGMIISSIKLTD